MRCLPYLLASSFAMVALVGSPMSGVAQNPAYLIGPTTEGMISSERVGAGDLVGYGVHAAIEPHRWSRMGFSYLNHGTGSTQQSGTRFTSQRMGIYADGVLSSGGIQYFGSIQPSLSWFNVGELDQESRVSIPMLGLGLGARTQLPGPLEAEIRVTNFMTYSGDHDLLESASPSSRSLGHNPTLQASIRLRLQRQERIAQFDDLPLAMRNRFQPVRPQETQDPDLATTGGRSHQHLGHGEVFSFLDGARYVIAGAERLGAVYFDDEEGHTIPSREQHKVREFSDYLQANPEARVLVRGYSTLSDSPRRNLTTAERRANRIRDQLIYFYDIAPYRVLATAVGGDPEAEEGDARRAEVLVLERLAR